MPRFVLYKTLIHEHFFSEIKSSKLNNRFKTKWKKSTENTPKGIYEYRFVIEKDSSMSNFEIIYESSIAIGKIMQQKVLSEKYIAGTHHGKPFRIKVRLRIDTNREEVTFHYPFPSKEIIYSIRED